MRASASRRDLPLLVIAVGVSAGGDIAAIMALAVHLQTTTGSGLLVAALFASNWLALAAVSPWAGRLVDRVESRAALGWASLAQALVAGALAFAPGTAATIGLVAVLGIGAAVAVPAEFALVGVVAARTGAARANGRVEAARYAGYMVGPLAGGALAAAAGTRGALLLDAASFLIVGAGAALLHVRRRPTGEAARGRRAPGGLSLLFADRGLRLAILVLVGSLVAMSVSVSADVFFVATTLGAGPLGLGLLYSAWMAGMVAGSLGAAPRIPAAALATAAIAAAGAQGAEQGSGCAARTPAGGARPLRRRRRRARDQECGRADDDPRARAGKRPRPRVRRLRRVAQRRRADGARPRRCARRPDRRAGDPRGRGHRNRARRARRAARAGER